MRTHTQRVQRQPFLYSLAFVVTLLVILSACGTNTSVGGATSSPTAQSQATASPTAQSQATASVTSTRSSNATPSPTAQSQANAHGCPNNTTVTTQPSAATVTLKSSNSGTPVSVKKGDTIEVDLLFGMTWRGPANAFPQLLAMQNPAGYASSTAKACVWRFVAIGTGTAGLTFSGQPICLAGHFCSMTSVDVDFTIEIK